MLNYRKHLLRVTIGVLLLLSPVHGERIRHGKRCGANYYLSRTSSGNPACVRCPTSCDPGTTIVTQCGFGVPQTCRPCEPTPGRTCASGVERSCVLCDVYGRTVDVPCNIYNQTTCGGCKDGYYENLDDAKIGNTRYCRKCTPADSWRQQCQLQPTLNEQMNTTELPTPERVTPSVTPAKPIETSEQMNITYPTAVPPAEAVILRLGQATKPTEEAEDNSVGWGVIGAGFVTTLLIVLLFAYFVYRYRSYDGQGKTTDIEMTTLSKVVDEPNENGVDKSASLFQSNPVCADMSPNDRDLPPGSCGHGVVHVPHGKVHFPHDTEYNRMLALGKDIGKDMFIEDHLTIDMQQTIAARINQRPATPGRPDYRNFFLDLGVDQDTVAAANAFGIDDPSERLFTVLLQESPEIKMADIIATLNKHKFYGPVKDICQKITDDNATEPK
ncbi:uncharacterized protein LOC144917078 [Branchiostoma floridae x Branchiostoma belcheri]